VATALQVEFFNYERFVNEGQLLAWPSLRSLDKATGQAKNTVLAGLEDLAIAGRIEVIPRYNPERRRRTSNMYRARMPAKSDEKPLQVVQELNQGGSDVCTRVVQTGDTDLLNDSLIQIAPLSALVADATEGRPKNLSVFEEILETRYESKKGEFEGEPTASSRKAIFTEGDVEYVQCLILGEVGLGFSMTIQKIVAMCREPGVYGYPIDGRQIAAMANAGYLGRHNDSVFVMPEMLLPALRRADE
jgi:hypothetical protein